MSKKTAKTEWKKRKPATGHPSESRTFRTANSLSYEQSQSAKSGNVYLFLGVVLIPIHPQSGYLDAAMTSRKHFVTDI